MNTNLNTPQPAVEESPMFTRRRVLALSAASAVAAALATVPFTTHAQSPQQDIDILQYALTLEHLEAAAYAAINSANILTGDPAKYFMEFGAHEAAHVDAITSTLQKLGATPVAAQAHYNLPTLTTQADVLKYFQMVEELGAAAYLGQAPRIQNSDILAAALSIHNVEAQHAAVLSDLIGVSPAPQFATPKTMAQVLAVVGPILGTPASGGSTNSGAATPPAVMPTTGAEMFPQTLELLMGGLSLLGGGFALRYFSKRTAASEPVEQEQNDK